MNQDEEVPARVTRGALRRRSIDQDATPQNAQATPGTTIAGGTPKKATSTKKAPALGAIQEGEGNQSTPIAGSRISRRRTSETVDTPTTGALNKLVQQLKESESVLGSGRRSRNTSLTEENLTELNAANESYSSSLRVRTPARLRGSLETLTTTTPATAPAALRRSTRRNSVTSDDGSVQSLPITTPKLAVSRRLKDEPIVEEEASDGRADSVVSESSPRSTSRRQLGATKSASQSPQTRSPVVSFRVEQTPPRGSVSPKVGGSSALKLPNSTPRSKNVSFADDSKQEDNHSSYPKTPTSPGKKFVLVGVNDLRNTPLINGSPKANAEIDLSEGDIDRKAAQKPSLSKETPPADSSASADSEVVVPASPKTSPKTAKKSTDESKINDASDILLVSDRSIGTPHSNDESGIEALESSAIEQANVSNNSTPGEGEKFSTSWNHSVRGSASKGIDAFSVRKQEEEEKAVDDKEQLNASQKSLGSAEKSKNRNKEKEENDQSDQLDEEEEEESDRNEFADDEAMEVDGYQSGDSMDDEEREEMAKNEISDQGEDLGSEDTEEDDLDGEFENDSFIVSDGDEDALLNGSGDDLSLASPEKSQPTEKKPKRRRILSVANDDDTGDEDEKKQEQGKGTTSPKSLRLLPSNSSPSTPRSATKESVNASAIENLLTDDESSPERKSTNCSATTAVDKQRQPAGKPEKTNIKDAAPSAADDGQERKSTPAKGDSQPPANTSLDVAACGSPASKETFSMDENESQDGSGTLFEASQQDVLVKKEKEEEKLDGDDGKSTARVSSRASRKSLPAGSTKGSLEVHVKGGGAGSRKSLPASARMHFVEEVATAEEVQLSASNLESSFLDDENQDEEEEATEKSHTDQQKTSSTGEKGNDAEDKKNLFTSNASSSDEEEYVQAKDRGEQETHEALAPAVVKEPTGKPSRKSLPVSSLISAQFYLAGSKKEKRNTIAVVEGGSGLMTSTPNGKQSSAKETKKENDPPTGVEGSTLVANPFALANASKATKVRARLSMDSAVTVERNGKQERTTKKSRNSLPAKLHGQTEEDGTDDTAKPPQPQTQQQHESEPEPMEVDEYVEEEEPQQNREGTEQEQKAKTPVPKKEKALEDFNLENILSRCNEVVRADKERKKQLATLAQKKRDEKRRLRQLREQQQSEEGSEGNDPEAQQREELEEDGGGQEEGAAASQQKQNSSSDSLEKKKKKRKKKLKNYVLEELAEMKKDRVAEAMLRKLQQQEERKQRKQERRAAKLNALLSKENGEAAGAAHGIGAKLEQVAKKKKKRQLQLEKEQAQQNKASEEGAGKPVVRVALSAFAVFQELQNGQPKSAPQEEQQQQQKKNAPEMQKTHGKHDEPVKEVPKESKKKTALLEEQITGPEQREEQQAKHAKKKKSPQEDTDVVTGGGLKKKIKNAGKDKPNEPAAAVVNTTSEKVVGKVVSPAGGEASKASTVAEASSSKRKEANKENILALAQEAPVGLYGKEKPKGKHHQSQPKVAPETIVAEEKKKKKSKPKQKKAQEEQPSVMADNKKGKAFSSHSSEKRDKGGSQAAPKDTLVSDALREIRETLLADTKHQQSKQKAAKQEKPSLRQDGVVAKPVKEKKKATEEQKRAAAAAAAVEASPPPPPAVAAINGSKKRKRDLHDGSSMASSTPTRPKKLRALQQADRGFIVETVTPEKTRLKRNFGFQEKQATPKAVGFKVSSVLPEDLRPFAGEPSKKKKKSKSAAADKNQTAAEDNPQPVWTRTGYFLEIPYERPAASAPGGTKLQSKQGAKATAEGSRPGKGTTSGGSGSYIDLKGYEGFKLKSLGGGGGQSIGTGGKPHRYDPDTVSQAQLSFKRQQLLEKTANLREKKTKGGGYV